ncbi:hypothetical protein BX589_10176 [Paraburkholderia fungorum]|uniref:hypothetical protein n=1 Tax=Paraburkholderia fungorum TaxID=134537 RepID=UPI000D4F87CE|nr:hypothetical protein [Paraburkholderia fungorum]PRZ56426.1 hypothetical protein BX589_10176 [Paraburkholderia fungorum]
MKTLSLFLVCAAACVSLPSAAAVAPVAAVAHDQPVVAQFPDTSFADDLTHRQSVYLKEARFPDGTVCVVAKAGNMQTPMALSCFKDQQDPQERH